MDRFGIKTRSMSENASLRQTRADVLSASTLEVIEGELLGDGNLSTSARPKAGSLVSALYQHNARDREYLEWLSTQLAGVQTRVYGPYNHGHGVTWALRSPRYAALLPVYRRWYDETRPAYHRKVVPADLRVTPRMALHWYLGDGTFAVDKRSAGTKPVVRLSTDSFDLADVERLAAQLAHCRARIGRFGKGYRIVLDSAPFLEWIGPCPVPNVHGHKWSCR